jgi:amino-acid N-acetyltransferase
MNIRKARTGDIKAIHRLLGYFADKGLLLPRSLSELYEHLRDFYVFEDGSHASHILGVCGLGICWENLAEVKSLAVDEAHQNNQLGTNLVETCLEEAKMLGLEKVFTLTYAPDFFARMGFKRIDKSVLPHKIWADCLKCPKFPDCDETAMMLDLERRKRVIK